MPEYKARYLEYLLFKADFGRDANYVPRLAQMQDYLADLEQQHATEFIVNMRYYIASWFFGERRIMAQYEPQRR